MNWLNLAFLPSIKKIEPDFQLKPNVHFKDFAAISKHGTAVWWLKFEILQQHLNLNLQTQQKNHYKMPPLPSSFQNFLSSFA